MTFTLGNALTFAPEGWLLLGAVAAFLIGTVGRRDAQVGTSVAVVALALSLITVLTQARGRISIYADAYIVDAYAVFVQILVVTAAAVTLLLSSLERALPPAPEFPAFTLLATVGAMLAAGAGQMAVLLVAVMLLLTAAAWMALFADVDLATPAAAWRALLSGSLAIGLLALGLTLLYGLTGTSSLAQAGAVLGTRHSVDPAAVVALVLVLGGCGAVLGMVPLHGLLAAGVRGQAPVVSGFVGTAAIAVMFSVMARILGLAFGHASIRVSLVLAILAALTMVGGYLFALGQGSLRRVITGALIAQSGYGLAAIVGLRHGGVGTMLVVVTTMAVTTFGLVAALATYAQLVHSDRIRDLAGMSVHAPGTALLLALALASLIGLPPLAGFFGKVLALEAAVGGGFAWLALIGALNAVLAAAVFAPVVRTAYFEGPLFEVEQLAPSWPRTVVLGFAGVAVLAFGVFVGPLSTWADAAARALLG